MNRRGPLCRPGQRCVPRPCGDEPPGAIAQLIRALAFPARAGMNRSISAGWPRPRGVPRPCGCSLACSAIHCCFVDVLVEPSVSSIVSHQWVCTCDASLSSDGSPWTGFPAVVSTMKALRLPELHPSGLLFRRSVPQSARVFVSAFCAPVDRQARSSGRGVLGQPVHPFFRHPPYGQVRASQVSWRAIPWLCGGLRPRTTRCASPLAALPVLPPPCRE